MRTKTGRTAWRRCSADSSGSSRRPAVARRKRGVWARRRAGTCGGAGPGSVRHACAGAERRRWGRLGAGAARVRPQAGARALPRSRRAGGSTPPRPRGGRCRRRGPARCGGSGSGSAPTGACRPSGCICGRDAESPAVTTTAHVLARTGQAARPRALPAQSGLCSWPGHVGTCRHGFSSLCSQRRL